MYVRYTDGMTKFGYFIVIMCLIVVGGIVYVGMRVVPGEPSPVSPVTTDTATSPTSAQIANPASVNCTQSRGGTLEIVDTPEGQQGMCHLPDGTVCEEWALMRGECGASTSTVPVAE